MNEELEPMWVDEGDEEIARIREVRHRISEQFGHDPYRLVAYYMELQKEHPEKLVPAPGSEVAGKGRGE
jgi:predicted house-cleaning noncanonical NTP pyrophosphatase (MazG superfamily)